MVADPEKYQLKLASIPNKPYFDRVDVGGQLDLARAADMAGISLEELYLLNPAFNTTGIAVVEGRDGTTIAVQLYATY